MMKMGVMIVVWRRRRRAVTVVWRRRRRAVAVGEKRRIFTEEGMVKER
jgi:hypothetical protein